MKNFISKHKEPLLTIIVTLLIFYTGIIYANYSKNDRNTIITIVLDNPQIFPFSNLRIKYIKDLIKTCDSINKNNYKKFDFGNTVTGTKEGCMNKALSYITTGIQNGVSAETSKDNTVLNIGNHTNGFLANAIGADNFSDKEIELYMANIKKLIQAIPENIPNKNILKKWKIINVNYLDTYAKIEFKQDAEMKALAKKGTLYRGQF